MTESCLDVTPQHVNAVLSRYITEVTESCLDVTPQHVNAVLSRYITEVTDSCLDVTGTDETHVCLSSEE